MNNVNDFIKNNYTHRNPGVRSKLKNMLKFGKLANTGKLVIFPVDQGFEHGPGRSFSKIRSVMILFIMSNLLLKGAVMHMLHLLDLSKLPQMNILVIFHLYLK